MPATLAACDSPARDIERIPAMDTDELRAELARALSITARNLLYLAAIWKELDSRGVDLSGLRSGLTAYLPLIASGKVLPEVVVQFAGSITLLRAVTGLPPEVQRKLASGESVSVAVRYNGAITHRMLPPAALTARQVRQVFAPTHIRTEAEQLAHLSDPPAVESPRKPVTMGSVVVDRQAGTVRIGRVIAPVEDVLKALRAAGLVS